LPEGKSIATVIEKAVLSKKKIRNGMDTLEKFKDPNSYNNCSMMAIGG
jgi:cyclic pyranopterin phosphate synthase